MTGTIPVKYLAQENVRGKKMDVFLSVGERAQLVELAEWFNCSYSEAVRTALRYAFASQGKYGS